MRFIIDNRATVLRDFEAAGLVAGYWSSLTVGTGPRQEISLSLSGRRYRIVRRRNKVAQSFTIFDAQPQ